MVKTSRQVQGDIYGFLRDSTLAEALTGGIYRSGCRPRDSRLEDAVVTFTAGLAEGDVQTGVVTVQIFVPDITPYPDNGVWIEDVERCETMERFAQDWVEGLNARGSDYLFSQREAISTAEEEAIHQHFVVVKIYYKYYD